MSSKAWLTLWGRCRLVLGCHCVFIQFLLKHKWIEFKIRLAEEGTKIFRCDSVSLYNESQSSRQTWRLVPSCNPRHVAVPMWTQRRPVCPHAQASKSSSFLTGPHRSSTRNFGDRGDFTLRHGVVESLQPLWTLIVQSEKKIHLKKQVRQGILSCPLKY